MKAKIKTGDMWRRKGDTYHVKIAKTPAGSPRGSVAHEGQQGTIRLYSEKDFRAKFEPLPAK